ncbi:MAG: helix-turn-helix transcriptional regulator [Geminicoccaceae bacterium]
MASPLPPERHFRSSGDRIIDRHERRRLVPYSDVQVWRMEKAGTFPRRVKLGPGRVGWSFNEIQAWIEARLAEGREG